MFSYIYGLHDKYIYMNLFEMFSVELMNVYSPQMKSKVLASTAACRAAPPSDTESETGHVRHPPPPPPPPATHHSDLDSTIRSSCSRAGGSDTTRTDLVSMQCALLSKLDTTSHKSPIDRQKDTFADFMKEGTYTSPPPHVATFPGGGAVPPSMLSA